MSRPARIRAPVDAHVCRAFERALAAATNEDPASPAFLTDVVQESADSQDRVWAQQVVDTLLVRAARSGKARRIGRGKYVTA